MPVTNVRSRWNAGNLEFYNGLTGDTLLAIDTGGLMDVGAQNEQMPILHYYTYATADGNTDNDQTLTYQTEIVDAWIVKLGAAGNAGASTVRLQTGAGVAISDAVSIRDAADGAINRIGTIDLTENTIAAGGVLRIRTEKAEGADDNAIRVVVVGRRV